MKTLGLLILVAGLLGACGGGGAVKEPARYDIGAPRTVAVPLRLPLASVEIEAASWLASMAMQYRLRYAEPLRRQAYGESRWVAPPGELLGAFIERHLASAPTAGGCRLRLALDEFEQAFDSPVSSQMVVELRASLSPPRGGDILARRGFRAARPASGADARSGVAAAQEAAQALAGDLAAWTEELARTTPALIERCRN